jgi:hypothetical protein
LLVCRLARRASELRAFCPAVFDARLDPGGLGGGDMDCSWGGFGRHRDVLGWFLFFFVRGLLLLVQMGVSFSSRGILFFFPSLSKYSSQTVFC